MQTMHATAERTTLNIDGATYRQLVEVARRNERSASAEARIALRQHLERAHDGQPARCPRGVGAVAGGGVTLRDELVRGAVYQAFEDRNERGHVTTAAAQRVIDVHALAPLLELQPVIDAVADWLDECRRQE